MIASDDLLTNIPASLRSELLARYREIAKNYLEHRWEPAELNGGKFAEVAFSIAQGAVAGRFPSNAFKPRDFVGACRLLEGATADPSRPGDRSLRILIPRQLIALYDIRNNRGVGHVGGDVDANAMDATAVFSVAAWVLAELIRVFHGVSTSDAQAAVDALAERTLTAVWIVPDTNIRRVLDADLSGKDQTLLLLHVSRRWVAENALLEAVEYSSLSEYRKKILRPLHSRRQIEFDAAGARAHITPTGSRAAEGILARHGTLMTAHG